MSSDDTPNGRGHDDQGPDKPADEGEDLSALARRYLDLWQDQISRAASDPALAEAMGRTFQALTSGAGAFAEAARRGFETGQEGAAATHADSDSTAQSATRPPPAAGASGDGGEPVAELAARLRRLEARVAALEAAGGARSPDPAADRD